MRNHGYNAAATNLQFIWRVWAWRPGCATENAGFANKGKRNEKRTLSLPTTPHPILGQGPLPIGCGEICHCNPNRFAD